MNAAILRVALDVPLRRLFDYLPPRAGAALIEPGMRVRVPFGSQRLVGFVVELAESSELPAAKLKPALEVLDSVPLLDQSALQLLKWAAEYYHHPIGEALAAAVPKALRMGAPAVAKEERWVATVEGIEAQSRGEPARAPQATSPARSSRGAGRCLGAGVESNKSGLARSGARACQARVDRIF